MKTRVHTGKNRCVWVCMRVYVCVGVQGARGTQKQGKGGEIMVSQALIWAYGRGNFPEHHVLQNKSKMGTNGSGWVRRGSHGCNRAYLYGGAGKQGEMRQKLEIRAYFAGVITGNKTPRC